MRRQQQVIPRLLLALTLLTMSCNTQSENPPETTVSYLNKTIPPCTPIDGSEQDPCPPGAPPQVEVISNNGAPPLWPSYPDFMPTFTELLHDYRGLPVHIVVRGVAQPGTTRCELYSAEKVPNFFDLSGFDVAMALGLRHYHCFTDISVREYVVGEGPPTLTVGMHRERLRTWNLDDYDGIEEYAVLQLKDPRARTAAAYEGKELVLFLEPSISTAVETWIASDSSFTLWFAQRNNVENVRAVARGYPLAQTADQRRLLDLPLTDLVLQVTEAAKARAAHINAGGQIGDEQPVPLIVTDANRLRDYYSAVGAVYRLRDYYIAVDGKGATVLPPPPRRDRRP